MADLHRTQQSSTSATAKTSTPSLTYAAPGRHAVGYREFTTTGAQQQPLTLRAWYPARRPADKRPASITYIAPKKTFEYHLVTCTGHRWTLSALPHPSSTYELLYADN